MRSLDPNVRDTVRAFIRLIESEGIPVHEARIFGSRARGTETRDSDIDVCVVSPAFGKDRLEETGALLRLAARLRRSYPLEPIAFSLEDLDDPWSALAAEIRRDGIPVR